eukprot:scaffold203_cov291-Alexandrium_tamarense.AAC.2
MSFFPDTNLVSSNDDDKENIAPNRRKAAASSVLSPVQKRLKKTAADSKFIRQAKKTEEDDSIHCLIKQIHGSKGILRAAQFTEKYKGKNAVRLDNQRHLRSLLSIVKNPSNYTANSVISLVIESRRLTNAAIVKQGLENGVYFGELDNLGDLVTKTARGLEGMNFAPQDEDAKPPVGCGEFNLMNPDDNPCCAMHIKIEGTRFLYEIKKQKEKDTEEKALVVLNDVALHDLVPIAYPNHGNEADNNAEITEICTALGIIDYELYLISALYLISHGIVHKMMTKKQLPYLNRGQDHCHFLHGGRGRFSTDLFQCLGYVDHAQAIYMGGPRRYSDEKLTTRNCNYCDFAIELHRFRMQSMELTLRWILSEARSFLALKCTSSKRSHCWNVLYSEKSFVRLVFAEKSLQQS